VSKDKEHIPLKMQHIEYVAKQLYERDPVEVNDACKCHPEMIKIKWEECTDEQLQPYYKQAIDLISYLEGSPE